MGIEKLTSSLLKEAGEEADKIVQTAKWHVQKMVEDERSKEAELKQAAEKDVEKVLGDQKNERLAWARLEAKRLIVDAKEDAIVEAMDEMYDLAPQLRKSKEYAAFLSSAVSDAAEELGGQPIVHVLKGEKKLLPAKLNAKVVEDLEGLGGAIVDSEDGKMRVDVRLETKFEIWADDFRKKISGELFK
jgi:vacuolar-type H+-ATPase subunit E/Vma4